METLRGVGPDAPTLCEGWTTRDLAAHLVIREYRPDATPGIMIPFLASHTAKVQSQVTEQNDWDELLDKVAAGPPVYSPFKLLDPVANVGEMFIHHEDVRRAQTDWTPRALEPALARTLRRALPLMSARPGGVAHPGGQDRAHRRAGPGGHGDRGARGAAARRGASRRCRRSATPPRASSRPRTSAPVRVCPRS